MSCRILINREECEVRVAFLENQELVELHTEKFDDQTIVNNVYRGKVQDVVPGLQAAFIDVGLERNMFLHFMDIRPESLVLGEENQLEAIRGAAQEVIPGRIEQRGRRPRQDPNAPQAAAPVKKGDYIVVQVVKDEIGGKAPRVTANISIAGRYLVMLPFPSQEGGVSRKIAIGQDRFRLKKLLSGLRTDDYSFIVRTAGIDQPEEAIHRDAENLLRSWDTILTRYKALKGPGLLLNDHDLVERLVRDAFPSDFEEVLCDTADDVESVRRALADVMPDKIDRVKAYEGWENIFEQHGVDKQIEKSMAPKYWLKSGGYLIIDENEALTAIDVNTGRFIGKKDQEKTSLKTNMEAAEAVAKQIRLRDIGGIIVVDFIDMLSRAHQERVSEELRNHIKHDRAKTAIGRIGDFGLMVLTRKRQRMSLQSLIHDECPYCKGTGMVRQPDEIFRRVKYDIRRVIAQDSSVNTVVITAHQRLIDGLTSRFRVFFDQLLSQHKVTAIFRPDPEIHVEDFHVTPIRTAQAGALMVPRERVESEHRLRIGDPPRVIEPASDEESEYEPIELAYDVAPAAPVATDTPVPAEAPEAERPSRRGRRRRGGRGADRDREAVPATPQAAPAQKPAPVAPPRHQPAAASKPPVAAPPARAAFSLAALTRPSSELPPPSPTDESMDDDLAEVLDTPAAAVAPAEEQAGDQPRKRTRRGRRGGRGRRRNRDGSPVVEGALVAGEPLLDGDDDEGDFEQEETPVAIQQPTAPPPAAKAPQPVPVAKYPVPVAKPAPATSLPPAERPKLTLALPKKPVAAILDSVLDEIEKQLETIKEVLAPALEPAKAPEAPAAAKEATPARKKRPARVPAKMPVAAKPVAQVAKPAPVPAPPAPAPTKPRPAAKPAPAKKPIVKKAEPAAKPAAKTAPKKKPAAKPPAKATKPAPAKKPARAKAKKG